MQVLLIKFCLLLRKGSTKVFTNVAASFVKASFVSSKEGFQQKFPQKMLQVLLKQVLFPVRVGLSARDFITALQITVCSEWSEYYSTK